MLAAALVGCRRRHEGPGTVQQTQTIAPAAAQPAPTGTDAMTQTVDVEDGRSEEDGGTTTTQQPATVVPATTASAKAPASKGRKK